MIYCTIWGFMLEGQVLKDLAREHKTSYRTITRLSYAIINYTILGFWTLIIMTQKSDFSERLMVKLLAGQRKLLPAGHFVVILNIKHWTWAVTMQNFCIQVNKLKNTSINNMCYIFLPKTITLTMLAYIYANDVLQHFVRKCFFKWFIMTGTACRAGSV